LYSFEKLQFLRTSYRTKDVLLVDQILMEGVEWMYKVDGGIKLDREWVKLIAEAKDLGIKKEEIQIFLKKELKSEK
jgi:hypothetical protein